jgi:uncharacterized membrane protein
MSDTSQGPGWWQASDGKWYPPEQPPGGAPTPAQGGGERLDLGAALSYGWNGFVNNLGAMVVLVVLYFGIQIVFNIVAQFIRPSSVIGALLVSGVVIAAGLFITFIVEAGLIRASLAVTRGEAPKPEMMFSTERLGPYLLASIVVAALAFVGILACCIGYVVVRLFLLFYGFYVLDKDIAPLDSLKKSFDLVSKNMGDVLVFAIVIVLINLVTCGLAIGVTEISIGYAYRKLNGEPIAAA